MAVPGICVLLPCQSSPCSETTLGGQLEADPNSPILQCSSCSQQFMQKKDLQSHMIKLHGAPKPHAVGTRGFGEGVI